MAEPAATTQTPVRRAALDALGLTAAAPAGAQVTLRALADVCRLNLRLDAGIGAAVAALAAAGWTLPTTAGGVAKAADGRRALWLGPDEWLLLAPLDAREAMLSALGSALAGHHHALVDLTDNYAGIEIAGRPAADVLAKGCPLDLDERAFPSGRVAQSLLGKADMILERRPDGADGVPVYQVTVRRSFARYAWDWLADGALEFGLAVAV